MSSPPASKNSKTKQRPTVAIIGLGHWGPNLVRVFKENLNCELRYLCDADHKRLLEIRDRFGGIKTTTDYRTLLQDPEVDAVVIATPTTTHYRIAKEALASGKHVLVEKPLATNVEECMDLRKRAIENGLQLMVGHVFLFNPAVQFIAKQIQAGEIGDIVYAYSTRVNLGPIRTDVNALTDLAPHDISIFNYWFESEPQTAQATGLTYVQPGIEDVAFVTLKYGKNILVNLHVGWLDPCKMRQIVVVGTKKMVLFDDLNAQGAVQVFDKQVGLTEIPGSGTGSAQEFKANIRAGNVSIPKINPSEPLREECNAFIDSIRSGVSTVSDALMGTSVVRALAAANQSLKSSGRTVELANEAA